ncbi:hypothetical protein HO929_02685 [Streptococcus suis]|nr:hypothetical protein [Streptococcus suis]
MIEIKMLSDHWERVIIEWYLDTLSEKASKTTPLLILPEELSYLVGGARELRIEAGTFLKKIIKSGDLFKVNIVYMELLRKLECNPEWVSPDLVEEAFNDFVTSINLRIASTQLEESSKSFSLSKLLHDEEICQVEFIDSRYSFFKEIYSRVWKNMSLSTHAQHSLEISLPKYRVSISDNAVFSTERRFVKNKIEERTLTLDFRPRFFGIPIGQLVTVSYEEYSLLTEEQQSFVHDYMKLLKCVQQEITNSVNQIVQREEFDVFEVLNELKRRNYYV